MPGNRLFLNNDTSFNQNLDLQQNVSNGKNNSNKNPKNDGGDANDSINVLSAVIKEEPIELDIKENNVDEENSISYPNIDDPTSDDDDADIKDFFSDNAKNSDCYRLPYTYAEDEEIINFVFKGSNLYKTTSILLWKYLASKKKNPVRTYQSLKNRFMRNIKPNLLTVYRHLIPDEESLKRIFFKFPELKKTQKNRPLNLPPRGSFMTKREEKERVEAPKEPVAILNSSLPESSSPQKELDKTYSANGDYISVTKEVQMKNEIILVTVSFKRQSQNENGRGIYETYLDHKNRNKVDPCPTCGGSGFLNLNEEETNKVDKTLVGTQVVGTENDKTPAKKNKSTNTEKSLNMLEENTSESCTVLNKSLGSVSNCSDDSDKTKDGLEDNLQVSPPRTLRKRSRTEKAKSNVDISTRDQHSKEKEEEDIHVTSMVLRNGRRIVVKQEVEPSPHEVSLQNR